MKIKVRKMSGKVLMHLKGTLDGSTACEIDQVLQPLVEGGGIRLAVDFSGVRKTEYFGVAILTRVLRSQCNQFAGVTFAGLPPAVGSVFKRFGLPVSQMVPADPARKGSESELPSWQTS